MSKFHDVSVWNTRFQCFMHRDGTWVLSEFDHGGKLIRAVLDVNLRDPWAGEEELAREAAREYLWNDRRRFNMPLSKVGGVALADDPRLGPVAHVFVRAVTQDFALKLWKEEGYEWRVIDEVGTDDYYRAGGL